MMAYFNPNQAPHMTDPERLAKFFQRSTAKSHPVQSGGGLVSVNNAVLPVGVDKPHTSSGNNGAVRLVTPVEAQMQRAREDIKSQSAGYNSTPRKRAKAATPHTKSKKKQKTRDVFN